MGLGPGVEVFAVIKSVAVARMDVGGGETGEAPGLHP